MVPWWSTTFTLPTPDDGCGNFLVSFGERQEAVGLAEALSVVISIMDSKSLSSCTCQMVLIKDNTMVASVLFPHLRRLSTSDWSPPPWRDGVNLDEVGQRPDAAFPLVCPGGL